MRFLRAMVVRVFCSSNGHKRKGCILDGYIPSYIIVGLNYFKSANAFLMRSAAAISFSVDAA